MGKQRGWTKCREKCGSIEEKVEEWVWKFCSRIWNGEKWPKGWRKGVIVPIVKRKRGEKVNDYRGVTLMPSLHKVYMSVLGERLKEEMEEKKIIPPNHTGFRKRMVTMDNIYMLKYLINKRLGRKKGKVIAMFVDLKAAFDLVDRRVLMEAMRQRGIREELIERVAEMWRETKSRVRVVGEMGEGFWTARGVRQGCPLSSLLFNLLIADMEEGIRNLRWGGIELGGRKVYLLAYADDVVLLAEEEAEMRSMIVRFEGYLKKKKLELTQGK